VIVRPDLVRRLVAANAGGSGREALDREFGVSRRLAVYGSLAPGEANHHLVAGAGGAWTRGAVRGELHPTGWGMTLGYPALCWNEEAPEVGVSVLESDGLPALWPRLDEFEGEQYRRILVPVRIENGGLTAAHLYVLAETETR
jgi:gamma-glutamylcyclotransferase (GGCT)/AIG2-like uncharacterized protein YtfP